MLKQENKYIYKLNNHQNSIWLQCSEPNCKKIMELRNPTEFEILRCLICGSDKLVKIQKPKFVD